MGVTVRLPSELCQGLEVEKASLLWVFQRFLKRHRFHLEVEFVRDCALQGGKSSKRGRAQ